MTLDTVGEFDTRGHPYECHTVRVVFDPVRRMYRVGYDWARLSRPRVRELDRR